MNDLALHETVALPETDVPIVVIGAGEIARLAHLPAYRKAGFTVRSVYDTDLDCAEKLARDFCVDKVTRSLDEAIDLGGENSIFDLAIPPAASLRVLGRLPKGCGVLIQKPMGHNLDEARAIRDICCDRGLRAAVNLQLRFAPFVVAARNLIHSGHIGELYNMEVRALAFSPSLVWSAIERMERVSLLYYAVHYLDMVRSFMGDPRKLYATTVSHRQAAQSAVTRSCTILNYGNEKMADIVTNHHREFTPEYQESYIRWEGDQGLIEARFQPNAHRPGAGRDAITLCRLTDGRRPQWTSRELAGRWVPDAFIGSMASLMRFIEGSSSELPTSVKNACQTMLLVEAAYQSNQSGGVPLVYDEMEQRSGHPSCAPM